MTSEPVAEARLVFDVYSQQHAWHAELWAERLPVLDGLDPATLTLPPTIEVDRLLALLAGGAPGQAPPAAGEPSCDWWAWPGWCCPD